MIIKTGSKDELNFFLSSIVKNYINYQDIGLRQPEHKAEAIKAFSEWIRLQSQQDGFEMIYMNDGETDEILSYVAMNRKLKVIYFAYTKSAYRKNKLAIRLCDSLPITGFFFPLIFHPLATISFQRRYKLSYKPELLHDTSKSN